MTILPDNPIPSLVARYRKLKAQRDAIDTRLKDVKAELTPAVEANSDKWQDDQGYARIITRKGSVNYSAADVHRYVTTWMQSDDPVRRECGQLLHLLRKQKAGYSYLQVK